MASSVHSYEISCIQRIGFAAFVLVIVVFGCVLPVQAQQKFPISSTSEGASRYVQQHVIEVGDIPGHQLRILEVHRTGGKLVVDGVKVVESWNRGFSDYTNGIGPAKGYGIWVMEDGNKIYIEWAGTSSSEPTAEGSRRGTYHGSTKIVGGTGRFAKLRGLMSDITEFDTDPAKGFSRVSSKGEYWFSD